MLFQTPYYYGSGSLQGVFQTLQAWGFSDAFLPFLLIFALVFAILQKIKIFKQEPPNDTKADNKVNGIIAFVIAALVVVPHITRTYEVGADPVVVIQKMLPGASVLLLVILMVMILLGLAGSKIPNNITWLVTTGALILLGITIVKSAFPAFVPTWFINDPNLQAVVIILLIMGLIVWFITREPTPSTAPGHQRFKDFVTNWFEPRP